MLHFHCHMATSDMRIDELSAEAGVPTRTIRYYTQQKLLPPPNLQGRVGYYTGRHVERLRLIKELQEKRFLPLSVIKQVIRRYEDGADLETMLVPLDLVFAPRWEASEARRLTRADLADQAGVPSSVVDEAEEIGLLFPTGTGKTRRYTQDDVLMLQVAHEWLQLGFPHDLARAYRQAFERISKLEVRAFNESIVVGAAMAGSPDETREALVAGYRSMVRTGNRLVALLHRKLLQQAVESAAADAD